MANAPTMSIFQLLSCDITLGGQTEAKTVVARHEFAPVTYPELLVLWALHGPNSIENIYDVGCLSRSEEEERKRLAETYGDTLVNKTVFPGVGARLPAGDNKYLPELTDTNKARDAAMAAARAAEAALSDATVSPATDKRSFVEIMTGVSNPTTADVAAHARAQAYTPAVAALDPEPEHVAPVSAPALPSRRSPTPVAPPAEG